MPRIYGLMIVKNEADIVGQCLTHALGHCEKIVVMDNMSTDATWDIVRDLADRHPGRIIAHARIDQKFHDRLRAIGYNAFHHELTAEDWWLRLDADEFLNEPPAPVIEQANRAKADFIRAYQMEFALTDLDLAAIERGQDSRSMAIEQRRQFYRVQWREYRLFRNEPNIPWDVDQNSQFPQNLSKSRVCPTAVFNRHYACRDVEQIKARIAIRAGSSSFTHMAHNDWRTYTRRAEGLHRWSPGSDVHFMPLKDFWLPRIRLELAQRFGLAAKPAA